MSLSQDFLATLAAMSGEVARLPRRQPGRLMIGSRVLRYADLHSVYYQGRQIFGERIYDFTCATDSPVILDCGAHVGLASLAFKERYPAARIRAFEADPAIAAMCVDNLREFGFPDVAVTAAAVWNNTAGVRFATSSDDAGHVAGGGGTVPSIRLKDVISAGPVDLLKLDVEGAEFAVLADCGDALRGVARLIVEVHAFREGSVGGLLALLEAQRFRFVLGDLHQATWMPAAAPPPFAACRTDKYYFSVFAWR